MATSGAGLKGTVQWVGGPGVWKEGVVQKMEKGLVGVKWTRKWARADALHMAYFASMKPSRSDPPRKVFTLDDCTVGKTSIALISKFKIKQPHSFMIEDKQTGYVAVFATESETENEAWINFLRQPAPDKRKSHLSKEIEMSLHALDLPPDSPEFSNTVFRLLCDGNDSMNIKFVKVLLSHLGKISADTVVETVSRELDPQHTGFVNHAVFQQWWETGGPSSVPDLQNSPTRRSTEGAGISEFSEFSAESHLEHKNDNSEHKNDHSEDNESKLNELNNTIPEETESKMPSALKVNQEWDNEDEGDDKVSYKPLTEVLEEHPEERIAESAQLSLSLDNLIPGMVYQNLDAQVVPSAGPDIGGQAVSIIAQGLNNFKIKSVTVCNIPATINRHTSRTLHITTNPNSKGTVSKESEAMNGDILITINTGIVIVFRSCYRYMRTVEFFAKLRAEQGFAATKSGYVITDFGPVVKGSDGYGVSLAFDSVGISTLKHWHKRWFELSPGLFRHARSPTDPFEEIIPLMPEMNVELVARARVGRPHVVRIEGFGKSLLLQAASDDDQLEWAAAIKQTVLTTSERSMSMSSKNVLVEIRDSSTTQGVRRNERMTPLEMLAQEYGLVQQMPNQKRERPSLPLTQEYVVRDSMISQQRSSAITLSPNSMTSVQSLRAVPARSRKAPQESVNLLSQQRVSSPQPPLREASNAGRIRDNQEVVGFLRSMDIDTESPTSVIHIFEREQVDLAALKLMTEQDLKDMAVPAGPRKKIVHALQLISGTDSLPTPTLVTLTHAFSPRQFATTNSFPTDDTQNSTLEPSRTTEILELDQIAASEEPSADRKPQLFARTQGGTVSSSQAALSFANPALRQKKRVASNPGQEMSISTTDSSTSTVGLATKPSQPETTLFGKQDETVSVSKVGVSTLTAPSFTNSGQPQTMKAGISALVAASLAKSPAELTRPAHKAEPTRDVSGPLSISASLSKPSKPKTRKPSRQAA